VIGTGACCERCPGTTAADVSTIARRRLYKAAVFSPAASSAGRGRVLHGGSAVAAHLYRAVTGQIVDVSAQVLVLGGVSGERRFVLTPDATAWRGGPLRPSALRPGDEVVLRLRPGRPGVADRAWANIGRVSGTIVRREGDAVIVSSGVSAATSAQRVVVIPPQASGRIQVRFPNLRPGYLIDVIGMQRRGVLEGVIPATSQPPYRGDLVPVQASASGRLPESITGAAIWHDSVDEPHGVLGVRYPALDPSIGCAEDRAAGFAPGHAPAYRDLPYLSVGSSLLVSNECTGASWTFPVTGCAPVARLFNDRCLTCGTSPRGRVAELTLASFVALGGELEVGCFNATLTIGR
jgi:hypothetical protein